MAEKTDLSQLNCSLAGALSIVGDWWALLVVRDALLGIERFGEFQKSLGLAKNILADRLKKLVADGVLERDGSERRPRYRLTEKGRELAPALLALMQWGDRWLSRGRPPMLVTDGSGHPLDRIGLKAAKRTIDVADLRFHPGPGAKPKTREFLARSRKPTRP